MKYKGLDVPFMPKKEWEWMLDKDSVCRTLGILDKCPGACSNCIYAMAAPFRDNTLRAEFYYKIFAEEYKKMNKIPKLENGMILHLNIKESEDPFVFIFNNCCQHVHIRSNNSISIGNTWSYLPEDNLEDKIDAIWTTRTSGALVSIMTEIITDYAKLIEFNKPLSPVIYYSTLIWTKYNPEIKEVTMEELNKMLNDKGLPSVKIKE